MDLIRPLIFHLDTKFGAKMLLDAEITAQNRNSKWRPSAILEFIYHHIDRTTHEVFSLGYISLFKFCANPMYSFEDNYGDLNCFAELA